MQASAGAATSAGLHLELRLQAAAVRQARSDPAPGSLRRRREMPESRPAQIPNAPVRARERDTMAG